MAGVFRTAAVLHPRSTQPAAGDRRSGRFRERGLLPVEPLPHAAAAVELLKWRLPGASLMSAQLGGVRQVGDPHAGGADEELFFGINLAGIGIGRQRGQELADRKRRRRSPRDRRRSVHRAPPDDQPNDRSERPPRQPFPINTRPTGTATLQVVPGHTAALHLLTNYLRSLFRGPVPTGALADAVVDHVTALIALTLGATVATPAAEHSLRSARLQAIKADITRHPHRSRPAPRRGRRPTPDQRPLPAPPLRARRPDLQPIRPRPTPRPDPPPPAHPRFADHTIAIAIAIAIDAGFADLSYFNRTFRRRYGTTPTEVAAEARPATAEIGSAGWADPRPVGRVRRRPAAAATAGARSPDAPATPRGDGAAGGHRGTGRGPLQE